MVGLGFEPGWWAQAKPLSYSVTLTHPNAIIKCTNYDVKNWNANNKIK